MGQGFLQRLLPPAFCQLGAQGTASQGSLQPGDAWTGPLLVPWCQLPPPGVALRAGKPQCKERGMCLHHTTSLPLRAGLGVYKRGAGGAVHHHIESNTYFAPVKEKQETFLIYEGAGARLFHARSKQKHAAVLERVLIC